MRGWSKKWFSHKFKGPGLRYEVAVSIKKGDIVWIAGPYIWGKWNDLEIFRDGLIYELEENERVEADNGYKALDPEFAKTPKGCSRREKRVDMQNRVRARQETVNKRLKQFQCLVQPFRHYDFDKHSQLVRAVAVVTQLSIQNGEPLFKVEYN